MQALCSWSDCTGKGPRSCARHKTPGCEAEGTCAQRDWTRVWGGGGPKSPSEGCPQECLDVRCLSDRASGRITGRHARDIAQGSLWTDALGKPFDSPALSQPLLLLGRMPCSWSCFPSCLAQKAQGESRNSTLLKPHELHTAFQPLPTRSEFSLSGSLSIRGSHLQFQRPHSCGPPQTGVEWGPGEQHACPSIVPRQGVPGVLMHRTLSAPRGNPLSGPSRRTLECEHWGPQGSLGCSSYP